MQRHPPRPDAVARRVCLALVTSCLLSCAFDGSGIGTDASAQPIAASPSGDLDGADDAAAADTRQSDARALDTGASDTGAPDTAAPDSGASDAGAPDAGAPDSIAFDLPPTVTCDALYATAPGYRLCGESEHSCRFYFNAGATTADCETLCGAKERCLGSAMELADSCATYQSTPCAYAHHDGLCLCTRATLGP